MGPPPLVKTCCIASVAEALMAPQAGAAALGLVSTMPSGPGVVSDAVVAAVAAATRGQKLGTFLLTARTRAESVTAQHKTAGTTTLQLVDHVSHADLRRLRQLCIGFELVQVIHVTGETSVAEALVVAPWVDAVRLDSGIPALAVKELGGTGCSHDWALSRRIRNAIHPLPLWLAGGLRAHNVAAAIAAVQPHGLDLCTGVRSEGRLNAAKLGAFMAAVTAAAVAAAAAETTAETVVARPLPP